MFASISTPLQGKPTNARNEARESRSKLFPASELAHAPQCPLQEIRTSPDKFYKGSQEKNTSPMAGFFLTSSRVRLSRIVLAFRSVDSGMLPVQLRSAFGFSLPAIFIASLRRSQPVLRPTSRTVVRWQPWFYLGLVAYRLFRVVRGGLGSPVKTERARGMQSLT